MRAWAIVWLTVCVCGVAMPQPATVPESAPVEAQPDDVSAERPAAPMTPGLVPPYAAVVRSAVLPGWGQFAIGQPLQGAILTTSTLGLMTGWWFVRGDYTRMYDGEYLPAVKLHGLQSDEAEAIYTEVNKRFKVAQALLIAAAGIWTFSLIDAYVDANIYNAERRARDVLEEAESIRKLRFDLDFARPSVRLGLRF